MWHNSPSESVPPPRILLIDDDLELGQLVREYVEREGFQLDADVDGRHAMRHAVSGAYQFIILDVMLPRESGFDLLRGIRPQSENAVQDEAVKAARKSVDLTPNQYKAGTVSYLNVITTQTIALTDEITAIQIGGRRMAAAVLLIQALGGGWNTGDLPSAKQVTTDRDPARKNTR